MDGDPSSSQTIQGSFGTLTVFGNGTWSYALNTPVTDDGLDHVRDLPQLERLDLRGTQVTDAGLERLKRSHRTLRACRAGRC